MGRVGGEGRDRGSMIRQHGVGGDRGAGAVVGVYAEGWKGGENKKRAPH